MDNRKNQVLKTVVKLYSIEGEPVGSTLLARHFSMSISSATLRSEMAALTKLGLLEQPHTSAGRIPSAKGYRYYIDNLLESDKPLTPFQRSNISDLFKDMDFDPQRITANTAKALASYTGFASATTTPESKDVCIAHFEIIRVGLYTAVVLAVSSAGSVSTRTAKFETTFETEDLKLLEAALNEHFTFINPTDLDVEHIEAVSANLSTKSTNLMSGIMAAYKLVSACTRQAVYIEGQENLLHHGINDIALRNSLALFSDSATLCKYLGYIASQGGVILGEDIEDYPMPGFCIMGKQYVAGGGRTGSIAIIGPSRMNFTYMMRRLDFFAHTLSMCMSGNYGQET